MIDGIRFMHLFLYGCLAIAILATVAYAITSFRKSKK